MSDYARIGIIGKSREDLLKDIDSIKAWGGEDQVVYVSIGKEEKTDSLENIENAIRNDLAGYILQNFRNKREILKSGGNDDLFLVPDPDYFTERGQFRKIRRVQTNFTPKKKKRKKRR